MSKGVTIAGGGLAGLALAVALRRRDVPVKVLEAGSYPRHRVCGEFISGVSGETLEFLGIADDLADARRHARAVWHREGRRILETELPEAAFGISRYELDRRLSGRVTALGGTITEGCRVTRQPREGLVWAAGRLPRRSEWLGLKCHVLGLEAVDSLEMHLGRNGYVGLAPVEGGRVNVCGLFRRDRMRNGAGSGLLMDYLRAGGNGALAERLEAAEVDESSYLGAAGFELGWQGGGDEICAIGDAEGMIPPFTGNGMSMAFESAAMAAEPVFRWAGGDLEWVAVVDQVRRRQRRRFRRRVSVARGLHRVLLNARGRELLEALSRSGMLPFRPLLSLVR